MKQIVPEQNSPANRKFKDSFFTKLFSTPESILKLYNALSQSHYPLDTPIEITTLENVLYKGRYNDLSFTIDGKLIILIEQQSSIATNLPARLVLYYARVLDRYIKSQKGSIYASRLIKIPRPEFIVLYNGKEDVPDEKVLKLSDAFFELPENHKPSGGLELTARVLNINKDRNKSIVQESAELNGYVDVVDEIRKNKDSGMSLEEAIAKAVKDCASKNILSDFLEKYGGEIMSLLYAEWDWDEYVAVQKEEIRTEVAKKALEKGMSVEEAADLSGLSAEEVEAIIIG